MDIISLQIQRLSPGCVPQGGSVMFESVVFTSGDIDYDGGTGVIVLRQPGRYVFDWWVAADCSPANRAIFALSCGAGESVVGNSPQAKGQVSGFAVFDADAPPVRVSLINCSGADVFYSGSVPVKASLLVTRHVCDQSTLKNLVDGNSEGAVRGIGAKDDYAMGKYATALGLQTKASGDYSYAQGQETTASGIVSHAEGILTTASGYCSHAEGLQTTASGSVSHAENTGTTAWGAYSHAEGWQTTASGAYTHAEGAKNTASGNYSHTEGYETKAMGTCSHAENVQTTASGEYSHAEGLEAAASGFTSHVEGRQNAASGGYSHAEGLMTTASGTASHAEGAETKTAGLYSHAEGWRTAASGWYAHAEGIQTIAAAAVSHTEGYYTRALGEASHAEGWETVASGFYAHSEGLSTHTDSHQGAHIMGQYGDADEDYSWFLANGTDDGNRGLAAKILYDGNAYIDVAWHAGGADYAELFETASGGPMEPGYFVTFNGGDKIRKATESDSYILGVSAAASGVVANAGELHWKHKYLTDEWGALQYQEAEIPAQRGADGQVLLPAHTVKQPALNPEWDPKREYVPRARRPEWVCVGLLGRLPVRDDGTCVPGGYCGPDARGVATAAASGCRVLKRTGEHQVQIMLK